MKQKDIHVGADYVTHAGGPEERDQTAARVRVLQPPDRGSVHVRVITPAARARWNQDDRLVTAAAEVDLSTRDVVATWEDWTAAAEQRAVAQARDELQRRLYEQAYGEAEAASVELDPNRPLPGRYQSQGGSEPRSVREAFGAPGVDASVQLRAAYIAAAGLGPYVSAAEVAPLFDALPTRLRRDVLAVVAHVCGTPLHAGGDVPAADAVANVLHRGVDALIRAGSADYAPSRLHPGQVLTRVEADFVVALRAEATAAGGELTVPSAPPMPDWADRSGVPAQLGWVRLALVPTTGEKLHAAGCRSVRDRTSKPDEHLPWWQVVLAPSVKVCGSCLGPPLMHPVEVAHLVLAASVWDARGRAGIEPWQRVALARLVAATVVANAAKAEPDRGAAATLTETLVRRPLGREGWDAYRWLYPPVMRGETRTPVGDAQALAAQRLNLASAHLPGLARLPELPADADLTQQWERLVAVREESGLLGLERLLFTLPGARY